LNETRQARASKPSNRKGHDMDKTHRAKTERWSYLESHDVPVLNWPRGVTASEYWNQCPRADWLLRVLSRAPELFENATIHDLTLGETLFGLAWGFAERAMADMARAKTAEAAAAVEMATDAAMSARAWKAETGVATATGAAAWWTAQAAGTVAGRTTKAAARRMARTAAQTAIHSDMADEVRAAFPSITW